MKDGDRAGLAMFRDSSAWIGVKRDNGAYVVGMTNGLAMGSGWKTLSTGATVATAGISGGSIYLRATANIAPSGSKNAVFSYSTDGRTFTNLGPSYGLNTTWNFFMGYRFGIFNYGTASTGGQVTVQSFQLDMGTGNTPSSVPGSSSPTTSAPSNTTPLTTTTTKSPAPTSGGTVPQFGQCGGSGWTGATVCVSPYKCTCEYSGLCIDEDISNMRVTI